MMEMKLGIGCVRIGTIERGGVMGILLEQTCEPHEISSKASSGDSNDNTYHIKDNDVVIWIENIDGGRVLQDQVNKLLLELNGFEIK